jgi:type VI secretion system secreted protein VgrG
VVIDAGMELTASGGGSFLKLDPGGVTLSGATIKINSGGAPGKGSGIRILGPVIPWAADQDKAGNLLDLARTNALPPLTAARLTAGMAPLCGKQSNGVCSREDCPCMQG